MAMMPQPETGHVSVGWGEELSDPGEPDGVVSKDVITGQPRGFADAEM